MAKAKKGKNPGHKTGGVDRYTEHGAKTAVDYRVHKTSIAREPQVGGAHSKSRGKDHAHAPVPGYSEHHGETALDCGHGT